MTTGEIVNLRLARKRRKRAEAAEKADANRLRSSIPGSRRRADDARKSLEERRHDGHFLGGQTPDRT